MRIVLGITGVHLVHLIRSHVVQQDLTLSVLVDYDTLERN